MEQLVSFELFLDTLDTAQQFHVSPDYRFSGPKRTKRFCKGSFQSGVRCTAFKGKKGLFWIGWLDWPFINTPLAHPTDCILEGVFGGMCALSCPDICFEHSWGWWVEVMYSLWCYFSWKSSFFKQLLALFSVCSLFFLNPSAAHSLLLNYLFLLCVSAFWFMAFLVHYSLIRNSCSISLTAPCFPATCMFPTFSYSYCSNLARVMFYCSF